MLEQSTLSVVCRDSARKFAVREEVAKRIMEARGFHVYRCRANTSGSVAVFCRPPHTFSTRLLKVSAAEIYTELNEHL